MVLAKELSFVDVYHNMGLTVPYGMKTGPQVNNPRAIFSDKRAIRLAFGVADHMACNPAGIARKKWVINGGICYYCEKYVPLSAITADHIIPLSRGGSCREINIVPACHQCNNRKGNRTLREWKMKNFKKDLAYGPDLLEIAKNTPLVATFRPTDLMQSA